MRVVGARGAAEASSFSTESPFVALRARFVTLQTIPMQDVEQRSNFLSVTELRNQLSQDLRTAMKTRDKVAVSLLRTLMATLDNAEAVAVDHASLPKVPTTERHEVPRKELTSDEIRQLLARELAERQRAHSEYVTLGLGNEAERLQTEIEWIATYL